MAGLWILHYMPCTKNTYKCCILANKFFSKFNTLLHLLQAQNNEFKR
jgi:hypothetical protein